MTAQVQASEHVETAGERTSQFCLSLACVYRKLDSWTRLWIKDDKCN